MCPPVSFGHASSRSANRENGNDYIAEHVGDDLYIIAFTAWGGTIGSVFPVGDSRALLQLRGLGAAPSTRQLRGGGSLAPETVHVRRPPFRSRR